MLSTNVLPRALRTIVARQAIAPQLLATFWVAVACSDASAPRKVPPPADLRVLTLETFDGSGQAVHPDVAVTPPTWAPAVTDYREFPNRTHHTVGQQGWEEVADFAVQWATEHARNQVTLADVKSAFAPTTAYAGTRSPEIRA